MSRVFAPREWLFLTITAGLLGPGVGVCYWTCDASWMAGFGALIVIAGILFAFTDLPELLEKRANALAKLRLELSFNSLVHELEDERHEVLTAEEMTELRRDFDRKTRHLLSPGKAIKDRIHAVEIFIVCLGTFVNGFGQKILEHLWK